MAIFTLFAESLSQHQLAYQLVYPIIPISAFSGMNACLRLFVVIRDFIIIGLLNFGFAIINPRAARVAVVLVSVCVSVKSHLTSGASVHPENIVMRATEGKIFVGGSLKPLRCRDPALPPLKAICTVSHFPAESAHVHYSTGFE